MILDTNALSAVANNEAAAVGIFSRSASIGSTGDRPGRIPLRNSAFAVL
jgi:hypothetical protein